MSVWVVLPSARPVAEVNARMDKWRDMGYRVAIWRDDKYAAPNGMAYAVDVDKFGTVNPRCDLLFIARAYPGYAMAVNAMARHIFETQDPACDWIVATGDDTDPDPAKRADEIAAECKEYLAKQATPDYWLPGMLTPCATFGVMQPTGDPWRDTQGRIIERIAGSPWLGREWCRRANKGQGPLWPEFTHMFGDEHLQRYAQHLGVFWQRPDLIHFHDHAQRDQMSAPAPHMTQWNTPQHWQRSKAIFDRLVAGNFQECAPID